MRRTNSTNALRAVSRGLTAWGAGACLLTAVVVAICAGTLLITKAPDHGGAPGASTDGDVMRLMALDAAPASGATKPQAREAAHTSETDAATSQANDDVAPARRDVTKNEPSASGSVTSSESTTESTTESTATPTRQREATATDDNPSRMSFGGRPLKKVRRIDMSVTAYSPDARSCGKWADGITASGYSVWTNGMKLVAADTDLLPFGTIVTIPGYNDGNPVQVLDRGGKIKGRRLDVLYPTHEVAKRWGRQNLDVTVWTYAD